MRVRVATAYEVVLEQEADKLLVETAQGLLCLLPRHCDCVSLVLPGILTVWAGEAEQHLAVDRGVLVKRGEQVELAARDAVGGGSLASLRATVEERYARREERDRQTRSVLARLEANFVRRFLELRA